MEKSSFASEKLVANPKDPLDVAVMKLIGGEKYLKIWRKKFGDLSNFAKFAKLFSHQTFVLYGSHKICIFKRLAQLCSDFN